MAGKHSGQGGGYLGQEFIQARQARIKFSHASRLSGEAGREALSRCRQAFREGTQALRPGRH